MDINLKENESFKSWKNSFLTWVIGKESKYDLKCRCHKRKD